MVQVPKNSPSMAVFWLRAAMGNSSTRRSPPPKSRSTDRMRSNEERLATDWIWMEREAISSRRALKRPKLSASQSNVKVSGSSTVKPPSLSGVRTVMGKGPKLQIAVPSRLV